MITPYDAALRLRRREMDDVRVSISVEINQMVVIDQRSASIDAAVSEETALAHADPTLSAHSFVARMQSQRELLNRDRGFCDARLAALRAQATEAYGSLRALESVATRHRDDVSRAAAIAEQSQIDDFSTARFARAMAQARQRRESNRKIGA